MILYFIVYLLLVQVNKKKFYAGAKGKERLNNLKTHSILALYDWITTVCCTIAVLTGLTTTIFLLAIYKKALPALPISIAFGILFYFVSKTVLVPYIGAVCVFGMVGL